MIYHDWIARKSVVPVRRGIEVFRDQLAPHLFEFQKDLTQLALRKGQFALFADTGLGKTIMQLEWTRHVTIDAGRVLILTPLAVAEQTVEAGAKFGVPCQYRTEDDADLSVVVTNYDRLQNFDPAQFDGIVLDECFAAGTLVDTGTGPQRIENICEGVYIRNAVGIDRVSNVHRREVQYAVRITIAAAGFVTSPNHPIFTQRGWVGAQHLRPGDYALETGAALSLVREGVLATVPESASAEVLRDILLSEMADETAGGIGRGPLSGGRGEARRGKERVVQSEISGGGEGIEAHHGDVPILAAGGSRENQSPIESHEARTFRAWGQWEGAHRTAVDSDGCVGARMGSGVGIVTGPKESRLSNELQARLRESESENRDRGGWRNAPISQESGFEEGRGACWVRVDGAEILEPGNPELEQLRDADGKLYFYDLGATRHPSYSVNGVLVHNSSILKNMDGKTRNLLIEMFRETPYKLCCSATPAPNDFTELGNHSEFLGVKSRVEMLSEYFVHDGGSTGDWRLKGHAVEPFWEWIATWGAFVKKPSDLGYEDGGFNLPPLTVTTRMVEVDHEDAQKTGRLFADNVRTLNDARATRRATMSKRVAEAVALSAGDDQCIVWCELNDEAEACAEAIPGAVNVQGSDTTETKVERLLGFAHGKYRVLVTKAKIAGQGLNLQGCARMVFLGASHSYEQTYQSIRRCWRFGQTRPVEVTIIMAETEGGILENYRRKEAESERLSAEMTARISDYIRRDVAGMNPYRWNPYNPTQDMLLPDWMK